MATALNYAEAVKYEELKQDMGKGDLTASQTLLQSVSLEERNHILHKLKEDDTARMGNHPLPGMLTHIEITDDKDGNVTNAKVAGGIADYQFGEAVLYDKK